MKSLKHAVNLLVVFAFLFLFGFTTSCKDKEEICVVSVLAGEGGRVLISDSEVISGWEVTLTAIPEEGYTFVNWTLNEKVVSTDNPYTFVVTRSTQFRVNFRKESSSKPGINNGHEYVDLGLSVKWAACNIGATIPEEYGDYFAWGEISTKRYYYWDNYKYCNGTNNSLTKYCSKTNFGEFAFVDNKTTLDLSDDAARVNWGGSWRMPTAEEQEELMNEENCTWTWTSKNGVNGFKITSKKNGKFIFLPAAGHHYLGNLGDAGYSCEYWSSSLYLDEPQFSYFIRGEQDIYSKLEVYFLYTSSRYVGQPVRAVCE
ncbi:MAG: hypothetical protein IKB57_00655 [Bacteroidaceae bacterium]|nr:hypothetical protein [Bacteroidaceae bacterium]